VTTSRANGFSGCVMSACRMPSNSSEPAMPYSSDMPYSMMALLTAPKMTYFSEASVLRRLVRM